MAVSEAMKIDVWSDIACPWCYIGKRRLEAALDEFRIAEGDPTFEVEYHSFELAPETPIDFDGSEVDFLADHKGIAPLRVKEMLGGVKSVARDVGLDYDFDSLQHTNTVKAHQLLHFAKKRGKQLEMKERLLRAYFIEGRHLGRDEVLADLAADIGLDHEAALEALRASHHLADVRGDQQRARELGITSVPFFVIDGRFGISGAQRTEVFVDALTRATHEHRLRTAS
jgi:predicted DsbA family dithiol-disulfide isomerase